mmetsp:Transcript_87022/g.127268  ORF Transcript_87022/g.127268 Transcript_87022/m.127268 type:complete len:80 (-) Transcript_87022:412-651(-)
MQLTSLLEQKKGFTYECFHGPARTSGLAESHPAGSEDDDMSGVIKNITYGDLWSQKSAHKHHGPPQWLTTAYEGLVHFH